MLFRDSKRFFYFVLVRVARFVLAPVELGKSAHLFNWILWCVPSLSLIFNWLSVGSCADFIYEKLSNMKPFSSQLHTTKWIEFECVLHAILGDADSANEINRIRTEFNYSGQTNYEWAAAYLKHHRLTGRTKEANRSKWINQLGVANQWQANNSLRAISSHFIWTSLSRSHSMRISVAKGQYGLLVCLCSASITHGKTNSSKSSNTIASAHSLRFVLCANRE